MLTLESITTKHGTFRKNDRVWIVDQFKLRAGKINLIGQWRCKAGTPEEYLQPFIRVWYDEKFCALGPDSALARWEDFFWRPAELDSVRPLEFLSNCCQVEIIGHDEKGHGKCSRCKENTTPLEPDPTDEPDPIRTYKGFNIYDSGNGKLTAFDDTGRTAIAYGMPEMIRMIDTMTDDEPDDADDYRDFEAEEAWANQPTPYDP